MRYVFAVVIVALLCGSAFAADVTIKNVPEGITEIQIKEWVAVLVERAENVKLNAIQSVSDAVKTSQTAIDTFRKANLLTPKFETVAEPTE